MEVLRTPEERFAGLPGFDLAPGYVDVPRGDGSGSLRVAYVAAGPADGPVVVLLHGEPSWSYLYRQMIPVLVAAGLRAVAPDLVGFGRSDKPAAQQEYTYARHVEWLRAALFDGLDLRDVTVVGQDWGGLIGLRLVAEHPDRFAAVVAANTSLPTGDRRPPDAFFGWQAHSQRMPRFDAGSVLRSGCATELPPEVVAAYDAPFPGEAYVAGARQFPLLVPTAPDDPAAPANRAAWEALGRFEKPFLCAFSDGDPITRGADRALARHVPGAAGQAHTTIAGAGHFLQEDSGPELATVVAEFVNGAVRAR